MDKVAESDWEVWKTFQIMRRQLDRALEKQLQRDSNISGPDYELLLTLSNAPDRQLRARDLGELVGWEKSRISHQVSRMETRGLVERRECGDDARGVWITLTIEGRRAVVGAMRDHTKAIREYFFDALTPEQLAVIGAVSTNVLEAIDPPACSILEETA